MERVPKLPDLAQIPLPTTTAKGCTPRCASFSFALELGIKWTINKLYVYIIKLDKAVSKMLNGKRKPWDAGLPFRDTEVVSRSEGGKQDEVVIGRG